MLPQFRWLLFSLPLLFLQTPASAIPPGSRPTEPFRYPVGKLDNGAELKYINEVPVLTVSGTPEEMGASVGKLALGPGKRTMDYPHDLFKFHRIEGLWNFFVFTGSGMVKKFPEPYRAEMEAMIRTSQAQATDVYVGNTFFDLKKVFACSAVMVDAERSSTGGPLLGRNLDYPSLGYINEYSLVSVYRPKGKKAFAMIGFPGLVGCISGMNQDGLCLAILEVYDVKAGEKGFNPNGIPYALCHRRLLEECSTIAEAKKLLESLPRTTTLNLVVADKKGVAVFEVTPDRVVQRDPKQGVCACTNHYLTAPLKPAKPLNPNDSFQRFASLVKLRQASGKVSPEDLRKKLDAVNLGELTLQTMVFEPATLKLHLALGPVPASRHPLRTIDLAPLLK